MAPNKTAAYNFTIVVPVYNEEDNMDMIEDKLRAYISHASHKSCVLFVDEAQQTNRFRQSRECAPTTLTSTTFPSNATAD